LSGIAVKDGVASLAYAPAIHSLRGNSQKRSGGKLVAMMKGDKIVLHHENEGTATVTIADVKHSNGVIHVIDRVVLPK